MSGSCSDSGDVAEDGVGVGAGGGDWESGDMCLVMGGADGFAPRVCAEGIDVFILGEVQVLDEGLAQVGEGGGGFGLDLTYREHPSQDTTGNSESETKLESSGFHA